MVSGAREAESCKVGTIPMDVIKWTASRGAHTSHPNDSAMSFGVIGPRIRDVKKIKRYSSVSECAFGIMQKASRAILMRLTSP